MSPIKVPKKLIEVALPLDDINEEAALRKRKAPAGYPTTLHKWWAQRPPAAARAVLFAQMVNDPGYETGKGFTRGVNKKEAALKRERLFNIIRELVKWENTNNESVLAAARQEIRNSWIETCALNAKHPRASELFDPEKIPAFYDPFAGSGAIPLEAQRLGLHAHASDLNPVAVLINKAMIEIPPRFTGITPIGPLPISEKQTSIPDDWPRASGLAEDVRRYGLWMREQAEKRIGHLYPTIEVDEAMTKDRPDLKPLIGAKLTVIAWLWARTVRSPNPVFSNTHVPLASTFLLSSKVGKEAWIEPVVNGSDYRFEVRVSDGHSIPPDWVKNGTKLARGANFRCIVSDSPIEQSHIRAEFVAKRADARLMAVAADGPRGRVYLNPSAEMERLARSAQPEWRPEQAMEQRSKDLVSGRGYGFTHWHELYTPRQLLALGTFFDLVDEVKDAVRADAVRAGMPGDGIALEAGGSGATAYAEAIALYLAFAASRAADYGCAVATWRPKDNAMRSGMAKQAIPMNWDYAEANPFGKSSAGIGECASVVSKVIAASLAPSDSSTGRAIQRNAAGPLPSEWAELPVISTDPPYYDNIGYADLADFFYVCLRRTMRSTYPSLFATLAVPKAEELIASNYRHGGKKEAEQFFLTGMTEAMRSISAAAHPAYPITIYYAFKQSETKDVGTASTGWETFLGAVLKSGLSISGTWPVQTEGDNRQVGVGNNALASSIILVCHRRPEDAPTCSRKDLVRELKEQLTEAIEAMLGGEGGSTPIAPVDLAQASIGPGMAVFSKYAAVLEANGEAMSVHTALTLINKQVDEVLGGENFDADTNFCLGWFQEVGWSTGDYGKASVLATAKATSVDGVASSGVIDAKGGKVKLVRPADYPADWDPKDDNRTPVWEALHQLIRALTADGEGAAGRLLANMPERVSDIRRLAFWLYTLCERKGWADDARAYNELVTAWSGIEQAAGEAGVLGSQAKLDI
jgi:putative DNA methylase